MIYFTDAEIDQLINEDLPYYDLTSISVKLGTKVARISYATREETVLCGMEEAMKIFEKFKINPTMISISGEHIEGGIKFLEGEGLANNVHAVWRTTTNLMEYSSGIATRMYELAQAAKEVAPDINVVSTRKTHPYTKKLAIKAIQSGGGNMNRLGLSDTILITDNHIKFLGGIDKLKEKINTIQQRTAGKSITVEVKTADEALLIGTENITRIQLDKMDAGEVKKLVPTLHKKNKELLISVTGNIDINNIREYAATGVNTIVSSSPYYGPPCDFKVNIEPVFDA